MNDSYLSSGEICYSKRLASTNQHCIMYEPKYNLTDPAPDRTASIDINDVWPPRDDLHRCESINQFLPTPTRYNARLKTTTLRAPSCACPNLTSNVLSLFLSLFYYLTPPDHQRKSNKKKIFYICGGCADLRYIKTK